MTGNRYNPKLKLQHSYPEFSWEFTINEIDTENNKLLKENWNPKHWSNIWVIECNDDIYDDLVNEITKYWTWVRMVKVEPIEMINWIDYYCTYPKVEETETYTKYLIAEWSEEIENQYLYIYL